MSPDKPVKANIFAAGAVLWRKSPNNPYEIEIALIHRPKYDDWSFPKGKLDPGETSISAAVREIHEETGITAQLGRHLSGVTYPIPAIASSSGSNTGQPRRQAVNSRPTTRWTRCGGCHRTTSPTSSPTRWTERSCGGSSRSRRTPPRSCSSVTQRPAAGRSTRATTTRGRSTRRVACRRKPLSANYEPSEHPRCRRRTGPGACRRWSPSPRRSKYRSTSSPFSPKSSTRPIRRARRARARKIAARGGVQVICSQGGVIPDLLEWWAKRDGITLPPARNRKASTWVLSLSGGRLVAADHIDSPLPMPRNAD